MWTIKNLTTPLLIFSLFLMLISCSSSTSTDNDDISNVPERPLFSNMEMQTSAFDQGAFKITDFKESEKGHFQNLFSNTSSNTLMKFNEIPAYTVASGLVTTLESLHQININMMNDFMNNWDKNEADKTDSGYVWDYEIHSIETGESFFIEVTASEANNDIKWSVIAELDSDEFGFEEQQIMEGTTARDGSTGQWNLDLEITEIDFFVESTISWVMEDETLTEMVLDLSIMDEGDLVETEGKYELFDNTGRIYDAKVYTPELEETSQNSPYGIDFTDFFEVEWDINSGEGFIKIGAESFCWDENQETISC